jgi:hypothetical protein
MASLARRAAAAALVTASLLGVAAATADTALAADSVSPATTQTFDGSGTSVGSAYNFALAQAIAAGFTKSQCTSHVISLGGGFWEVDLTCTN